MSPEDDVQYQRHRQHDYPEDRRTLIPWKVTFLGPLRQRVHQTHQFFLVARPCKQADDDCHHKASTPRKDSSPEVLRHLARIDMGRGEPPTLHPAVA